MLKRGLFFQQEESNLIEYYVFTISHLSDPKQYDDSIKSFHC